MTYPHTTKRGPGRTHRDGTKRGGKKKFAFVQGLMNQWNEQRRKSMPKVGVLRDENGAFTLTGRAPITGERRMWLAGISAQRGY